MRDRSGSQVQDILFAYLYCQKNNIIYMGACDCNHQRMMDGINSNRIIAKTSVLCNLLGLPIPIKNNDIYYGPMIINEYKSMNIKELINNDFIKILYENAKKNFINIKNNNDFIVSLHIRRGDVQNYGKWKFRYVDNNYYLKIISEILKIKPNAKFYLFSDGNENFEEFKQMGCVLKINGSDEEAWNYFIQSDVFVMGNSSYSYVPAIFNIHGIVVYHQSKYFKPLDSWISDECLDTKIEKIRNKLVEII